MSSTATKLAQLEELQRTGTLTVEAYLRMVQEVRREEGAPSSPTAVSERGDSKEDDHDDEELVGEDGDVDTHHRRRPSSPRVRPTSPVAGFDINGVLEEEDGLEDAPAPATPQKPSGPVPDDPRTWAINTKVISTDLGEVNFIRIGTNLDFLNEGRAKVSFQRLKNGFKKKMETHVKWVLPATLSLPPPSEEASPSSVRRVSPRTAARSSPAAAEGPELAAHERRARRESKAVSDYKTAESKVTVAARIAEFPNHSLCENPLNQKLRCAACAKDIFNKWGSINDHCKLETRPGQPSSHAKKLKVWLERGGDDAATKADLVAYYKEHPNESVPANNADELLYRYRVAETFVYRPPFERADDFRPLLERAGHALSTSSHLKPFIPKIEKAELDLVTKEVSGEYLGIAFDGTTRLGEALNVTGRWCSSDFKIIMRLLDFTTLKKHVDHVQLATHVNEVTRQRGIPIVNVVNLARDSVSVNGAACRRLISTFTSAADSLCFCHTLCHVGERFALEVLVAWKTPWLELAGGRDPHRGAQALWKQMVAPATVPGYSKVRWYAWAEILFVLAEAGMKRLGEFITECENREYGDPTQKKLRSIYDEQPDELRLQLAAMLDMRILVKITYELEGDRLELLLVYDKIEALRSLGRAIKAEDDGVLPNTDAVLRRTIKLQPGVKIEKHYHGHGLCVAKLVKEETVNSTLYPGQQRKAWVVKYEADGLEEHFEEEELRSAKHGPVPAGQDGKPVLIVRNLPERKAICKALVPGFEYLEARITGTCDTQYRLNDMYELCRVVRAFDPSFAKDHLDAAFVDSMSAITPLNSLGMLNDLKQQLPQYMAATASAPAFDKASVADYSDAILSWWRSNGSTFPAWALAARIVFAISPNSASCERVFALLKNLFGEQQMSALADYVQAALMLNYNQRRVG